MNHGREDSKVPFGNEGQCPIPYFSHPSFSLLTTPNNHTLFSKFYPMSSTMDFNDLNNSRAKSDTGNSSSNSNSFTTLSEDSSGYCDVLGEHSYAKSDTDSSNEVCGDASDEEVSLDDLLLDGKTKEKIELLAEMVGVDATNPLVVLNEVVRVLKVLKRINHC